MDIIKNNIHPDRFIVGQNFYIGGGVLKFQNQIIALDHIASAEVCSVMRIDARALWETLLGGVILLCLPWIPVKLIGAALIIRILVHIYGISKKNIRNKYVLQIKLVNGEQYYYLHDNLIFVRDLKNALCDAIANRNGVYQVKAKSGTIHYNANRTIGKVSDGIFYSDADASQATAKVPKGEAQQAVQMEAPLEWPKPAARQRNEAEPDAEVTDKPEAEAVTELEADTGKEEVAETKTAEQPEEITEQTADSQLEEEEQLAEAVQPEEALHPEDTLHPEDAMESEETAQTVEEWQIEAARQLEEQEQKEAASDDASLTGGQSEAEEPQPEEAGQPEEEKKPADEISQEEWKKLEDFLSRRRYEVVGKLQEACDELAHSAAKMDVTAAAGNIRSLSKAQISGIFAGGVDENEARQMVGILRKILIEVS
jgi:hypothetical protein